MSGHGGEGVGRFSLSLSLSVCVCVWYNKINLLLLYELAMLFVPLLEHYAVWIRNVILISNTIMFKLLLFSNAS